VLHLKKSTKVYEVQQNARKIQNGVENGFGSLYRKIILPKTFGRKAI
jgi:hypothetical protein